MRLLVFFDLPMVTKAEKRAYVQFRRFLLNDDYDMIQWSVYGRILNGRDAETKHLARLANSLPPEGSIRCMTVTEKQFAGMRILVSMPLFQEKKVPANQIGCRSDASLSSAPALRGSLGAAWFPSPRPALFSATPD